MRKKPYEPPRLEHISTSTNEHAARWEAERGVVSNRHEVEAVSRIAQAIAVLQDARNDAEHGNYRDAEAKVRQVRTTLVYLAEIDLRKAEASAKREGTR
jgi:3-methyladenine DNA glycosylase Tag